MLKVVQAVESLLDQLVKQSKILFASRMRFISVFRLDAAERLVHNCLGVYAEIFERLCRDGGGKKTTHRLLDAAVRIVDQIRQSVEHRYGHARRYLNCEPGSFGIPLFGQIEFDGDVVAAQLAGSGDQFFDAVFMDDKIALHRVGVLAAARRDFELRIARLLRRDHPINAGLAIGFHFDAALKPKVRSGFGFFLNRPLPVRSRSADARNRHSFRQQSRRDGHRLIGVVVDDRRNRRQIAGDEEARGLQTHNQWLFCARSGRGEAELIALGRHARRRPPARERVGEFHFDDGFAVLVGDDVRLPEYCRAEIAANLNSRLLARGLERQRPVCSEFRIKTTTDVRKSSLGSTVQRPTDEYHSAIADFSRSFARTSSTLYHYTICSHDEAEFADKIWPLALLLYLITSSGDLVLVSQH